MIPRRSNAYPFPLVLIFAILTAALGYWGWHLAHIAFTQPPPASQVYATVFVRDPAAHVSLKAEVNPDEPWEDQLTVTVPGATGKHSGWLLIIECPSGPSSPPHTVHLYSEAAPQIQSQATRVAVYSGVTNKKYDQSFDCFSQNPPLGTPGYPPSLGNVSLPALQTDQEIQIAQTAPILYAQQDHPGSPVGELFQIFPGAVCPTATAVAVPTITSGSESASPTATPSSQVSAPSTSTALPTALPSTVAPPAPVATPGCYNQAPPGANFIPYGLPASVATSETLRHVNVQGYQVNSMFPVGTTTNESDEKPGQTAEETIAWNGLSGLSPSLNVTNTAAGNAAGHDTFWAGILVGAAGGFAVTFVDKITDVATDWWKRRHEEESSSEDGEDVPQDKRYQQEEVGNQAEPGQDTNHPS